MNDQFDKPYFDARFDGLEKLMTAQMDNMGDHIKAVSANGKLLEADLNVHKESTEAHGRKAADGAVQAIVAWIGLGLAAIIGIWEIGKHR